VRPMRTSKSAIQGCLQAPRAICRMPYGVRSISSSVRPDLASSDTGSPFSWSLASVSSRVKDVIFGRLVTVLCRTEGGRFESCDSSVDMLARTRHATPRTLKCLMCRAASSTVG